MVQCDTSFARFEANKLERSFRLHQWIFNDAKCEAFIMIEDDMLVPENTIIEMMKILEEKKDAGMVVIPATYRCPHIHPMGCNIMDSVLYSSLKVIYRRCVNPDTSGIIEAQGGWAVCAMRTKAIKEVMKIPVERTYIGNDLAITGLFNVRGWKIYAIMDMWAGHMQEMPKGIYVYKRENAIRDEYTLDRSTGRYRYRRLQ